MVTYLQDSANLKSFITSVDENRPLTTPFCKASTVAGIGMPTGLAPHALRIFTAPPGDRRSSPFISVKLRTGTFDMMLVGAVVNMVKTLTLEKAAG